MGQSVEVFRGLPVKDSDFLHYICGVLDSGEVETVTIALGGFSMRPFLEDGRDKAVLTRVDKPQVGQPILAYLPSTEMFVLHRIVRIEGDEFTLLGDGNLTPEYCTRQDLRASVVGFYRKGRSTLDRVDGWKWKCYSAAWMSLLPWRRWLLAFYRRVWLRLFK